MPTKSPIAIDRTARFAPVTRQPIEFFLAGDRVMIPAEDERVYEIIHISRQKAWVCPLSNGRQRIVASESLELIQAGQAVGMLSS